MAAEIFLYALDFELCFFLSVLSEETFILPYLDFLFLRFTKLIHLVCLKKMSIVWIGASKDDFGGGLPRDGIQ